MSQTIIFRRPSGDLREALEEWFESNQEIPAATKPIYRNEERGSDPELWVEKADDAQVDGLYASLRNLTNEGSEEAITGFYWAIFPEGTIWGQAFQSQKAREERLFNLATRPRDLLRRVRKTAPAKA